MELNFWADSDNIFQWEKSLACHWCVFRHYELNAPLLQGIGGLTINIPPSPWFYTFSFNLVPEEFFTPLGKGQRFER